MLVAVDNSDASHRAATFVNYFFDGTDVEILAVNVLNSDWALEFLYFIDIGATRLAPM